MRVLGLARPTSGMSPKAPQAPAKSYLKNASGAWREAQAWYGMAMVCTGLPPQREFES
jgi:hypothetical protein